MSHGFRFCAAGLAFLLAGCYPLWFLTDYDDALLWSPGFSRGLYESPVFQTKFDDRRYDIWLVAQAPLPHDVVGCLMGTLVVKDSCDAYPNQVDFKWELWGDERLVSSGVEKGHATGSAGTDRILAMFMARAGVKYKLRVDVRQDGPMLESAKPTFRVHGCFNVTNRHMCT
ncbi:MAG TPA: hypothetical protein VMZ74_03325 [Ramlibacter sp.]|nr:hypothetical protein [Ramlibacter sp.]